MSAGMATCYRRNPKVEESPLQGELMLFEPVKGRFFVLNRTMAYLWQNCEGEKTFERIVESVPGEFSDTGAKDVAGEMRKALDELVALGLVTTA